MNLNLCTKIKKFQKGNTLLFNDILIIFENILNKYSRLLNNEDTKQDLTIFLLELITKIPIDNFSNEKQLFSYIIKSIKFEYIRLSKYNSKKFSNETYISDKIDIPYNADFSKIEILNLFNILTDTEKKILYLFIIKNLSLSEISKVMNVSRQAVHQNKNRAIQKIKKSLDYLI